MIRSHPRRAIRVGLAAAVLALAAAGVWQASRPAGAMSGHERAVALERTLRCPTCQGLSVADSPSPIAAGMRQQVEQKIAAGATPDQVRGYFVNRYSDWILLDPPRRGIGWVVWLVPLLGLLAGLLLVRRTLRRRSPAAEDAEDEPAADGRAAAAAFADNPPDSQLTEPIAAALADLRAARLDAELDHPADATVEDALARLAATLREHPLPTPQAEPDPQPEPEEAQPDTTGPTGRRRRVSSYALASAAVLFAGLLAVTLTSAIGDRPAGAVITGNFATAAPGSTPATEATDQLVALQRDTQTQPKDPVAWLAYATALDKAGKLADAEPAYKKTLALDPGNTAATEQYAWLLTRGGAPSEALPLLTPLAQQRPDDPQVLLLLGLAQRGTHDPHATATLRQFLELASEAPEAAVIRGLLGSTP